MYYLKPKVFSYDASFLVELIGPCQTQAYLNVGGGRQAMLGSERIEYQQVNIVPESKLVQIKIKNKITV